MSNRPSSVSRGHRQGRRFALLVGVLAIGVVVTVFGSSSLWPILALPTVIALPLAGQAGFAFAALVSACTLGVVAGSPGAGAVQVVVGWITFVVGAGLVGARYGKVQRDLNRVVGASVRDRLTGLHNFAYFSDTLRRETERVRRYGGPLTLVLFDLDGFKSFNDTHGHEAGNRLLEQVGKVLEAQRRSADLAARFGGEEFALLVPVDSGAAWEVAERIRMSIARITVPVGNGQHDSRTISAGIAAFRQGQTPEMLIEAADRALYVSKRRGRNRVTVAGETPMAQAAGA